VVRILLETSSKHLLFHVCCKLIFIYTHPHHTRSQWYEFTHPPLLRQPRPPSFPSFSHHSLIFYRSINTELTHHAHQTTTLKSIRSLAPLLDRVLVQRTKAEARTAGGIFLPESAVKELNEAQVIAVGPGALDKEGKRMQIGVKAGDKVLIPQVSLEVVSFGSGVWRACGGRGEARGMVRV